MRGRSHGNTRNRNNSGKTNAKGLCKFCGYDHPFDRAKSAASGKTCHKCDKQSHFALKCHEKKQGSSKPANKVHQTSDTQPRISEDGDKSDDSISIIERVGVVSSNVGRSTFMVPLTFHTEYTPTVTAQLDTGATCSAMSYADMLRNTTIQ